MRSLFGTVFEIRCGRFSCDVVFAVVSFDRAYFFKVDFLSLVGVVIC